MPRTSSSAILLVLCLMIAVAAIAGCESPPAGPGRSVVLGDVAEPGQPGQPGQEPMPAVYAKLAEPVDQVRFPNVGFENALSFLADLAKVNISPTWPAMEAVGINKDTAVTLQLRDVTFETALREMLVKAAGREGVLDFDVQDNVIRVSTVEELDSHKTIEIYNVRDLREAYLAWLKHREKRYAGKLPEIVYDPPREPEWTWGVETDYLWTSMFLDLIRAYVLPACWAPQGDANILETKGLLVVKQTPNGHRELAALLMTLRQALAASNQPAMPKLPRLVLNDYERVAQARLAPATQPGGDPHLPVEPAVNERVRQWLRRRQPEFRFKMAVGFEGEVKPISFENALRFISDLGRLNINPNWAAMEAIGVTRETPIILHLKDVSFETALRELLTKAAGRADVLDWMIRDGVIKVSTVEDLASLKYIRIYDVRDLISAMDRAHDKRWELIRDKLPKRVVATTQPGGPDYGGIIYGEDDLLPEDYDEYDDFEYTARGQDTKMRRSLVGFFYALVLPDTWVPQGSANILEYSGLLIVKQTAEGHRKLSELLTRLRASYAAAEAAEQPAKN